MAIQRRRGGALTRYEPFSWDNPFALMRRLSDEMDRVFADFFGGRPAAREAGAWAPDIEMFQRGNELVVRADLPGLSKDDVQVELTEDALVLRGERKREEKEEREGFYRSERSYGAFERVIPLPEGTIAESAKATFKNGVLEIVMQAPPKEARQGRRIEIQQG
ncbi:MAG TPA: Hsp20/alpha crystallin family protein [Vicinamibacterales bacterium]|nr:Hsp20/alpha crystallin family protein [Vicinamibacterales bacterium]